MDRILKARVHYISLGAIILLSLVLVLIGVKLYLEKVDEEAEKYLEKTETVYLARGKYETEEGLYVANVKDDILEYIKNHESKELIYEFDGESFYVELLVAEEEDDVRVDIVKIASPNHDITARVNIIDIEKIEYRTGNVNQASLLKIYTPYKIEYFVVFDGNYYFLGEDIESISFVNGQFYYGTFNPKYDNLKEASTCSDEVKSSIGGFNNNDYYYRYGKINFLPEYYQKLPSKNYSVKDRCEALEAE